LNTKNKNNSMGPGKRNKSVDDQIKREGINTQEAKLSYQQQTVLNLHNCGIAPEIIVLQLDSTKREVISIIRKVLSDDKRKVNQAGF
jgi:hypothetical protein